MKGYNAQEIEKKWQQIWQDKGTFRAIDFSPKPKFYGLVEFPYPSGAGLHVGHIRAYTSLEVVSRMRRMQGYNVLYPIGWDAFGLPTENYAMKTGEHPRKVTDRNIHAFLAQLKRVGYGFDYDRMVDTTDPDYYRWTQWIFLQLFKHGLAYRSHTLVNFCPECNVVLANEESQGGVCDRCGAAVEQREKDVWFLRIRDYAEKLLQGLDGLDFMPRVKLEQEKWIGRSVGAEIDFALDCDGNALEDKLRVFTTRPDTLFGVTFMVMAPEHPLVEKYAHLVKNMDAVREYQHAAKLKNEFQRVQLAKDKTGVKLEGICARHPVTGESIPLFIADYVMMGYGTGAIMAVPGHDTRDWDFAHKYGCPVREVIAGGNVAEAAYTDIQSGTLVNSQFLDGLSVADAKAAMVAWLQEKGIGKEKINYNMKDWAFNRQRYWGEPIPIVHCPCCGMVPVPEEELPLRLPDLKEYKPSGTGESPLANLTEWVNTTCPVCGGPAKRETDTMPQWAGSSWYFLRYIDPHNKDALADPAKLDYWGQVDWYSGGMEHVTRHLIYSRFWNLFLHDIGVVPHAEPYRRRTIHGLFLGADHEKMSKSRGNVVDPSECIDRYGADVLRTFILFIGDYERPAPWSDTGIAGCRRFVERVWKLQSILTAEKGVSQKHESSLHKLIKKVTDDFNTGAYNTAIAAMMSFINEVYADGYITVAELETLLKLYNPVAPHLCEEMYQTLGHEELLAVAAWPTYDPSKLLDSTVKLPIQIMGKMRGVVEVRRDATLDEVREAIAATPGIQRNLDGKTEVKVIYVPNRICNFIVK